MATSPLRIVCRNCGLPVTFDIEAQTYCCAACGLTSGIEEAHARSQELRQLNKQSLEAPRQKLEATTCSGCGAQLIFPEGEALSSCDFCGSRLVRSDVKDLGFAPDLVVPFVLTEKEAKERLRAWMQENKNTPEARVLTDAIDELHGYYLPYELVRGPIYAKVNRAGGGRTYYCRGFLEDSAVNCVAEMDSAVLDAADPFVLSEAKPFEYGYIAGHRALIGNLPGNDVDRRARRKTETEYLPEVMDVLQSNDVRIKVESKQLLAANALLPLYVVKKGHLTAAVNGQTGRVAVAQKGRMRKPVPLWIIEAALYTLIASACVLAASGFDLDSLPACFVFAAIFFAGMGCGWAPLSRRLVLRGEAVRARRKSRKLVLEEAGEEVDGDAGAGASGDVGVSQNTRPVFYERIDGKEIPVELVFYPPSRVVSVTAQALLLVLAPILVAGTIVGICAVATGGNVLLALSGLSLNGGIIWYIFAVLYCICFHMLGMRCVAYDHPYLYERLADGSRKLVGHARDRRLNMFSLIFADEEEMCAARTPKGFLVLAGVLFAFAISVVAIIAL